MVKIQKTIQSLKSGQQESQVSQELKMEFFGWESGFYQKSPRKITATGLITGFWKMQQVAKNTLRNWAVQIGVQTKESLTKQSLDERLGVRAMKMVKSVLEHALNRKKTHPDLITARTKLDQQLSYFNRIMIHDSTFQQLPISLHDDFPANYSHDQPTAGFRLQALFNLTAEKWEDYSVDTYSANDQSRALWPMNKLQPRDLLIRDLGYFTLDAIEKVIDNQFIITKWKTTAYLYHRDGKKIDIPALFKGKKQIDIPVLLGSKKRIPLRLVARRLPKKKAAKRLKEAKKDRHARTNHSEEYFQLLKYEIYLTNVPKEILDVKQVAKLYGLRWYIEILFKSWKSYFNFKDMFLKERMKYHRTLITIYILLIQFVYLTNDIYNYLNTKLKRRSNQHISMLKFMDVANDLLREILSIRRWEQLDEYIDQFAQHATYGKRQKRTNMKEKCLYFKELHID